jgi:CheY-like chemotaxis protein
VSTDPAAQLRHELRTPLNHIIGYAEMLLEELEAGDQPALAAELAALRTDARQLLALLNEVLAQGHTGPPDLAAARDTLRPPLERVRAAGDRLRRQASEGGNDALGADLDRIRTATERLDELLRHGGVPPARAHEEKPAGGDGEAARTRGVILVVDDNEDNRDMLARRLRRQGYEVPTAAGGRAALAALATTAVDLVLLDVMMPDKDGFEVCRQIKQDARTRTIPVIFLTAKGGGEALAEGFESGAVMYINKPFTANKLLTIVNTMLESGTNL